MMFRRKQRHIMLVYTIVKIKMLKKNIKKKIHLAMSRSEAYLVFCYVRENGSKRISTWLRWHTKRQNVKKISRGNIEVGWCCCLLSKSRVCSSYTNPKCDLYRGLPCHLLPLFNISMHGLPWTPSFPVTVSVTVSLLTKFKARSSLQHVHTHTRSHAHSHLFTVDCC